jgi:hypothetical protein
MMSREHAHEPRTGGYSDNGAPRTRRLRADDDQCVARVAPAQPTPRRYELDDDDEDIVMPSRRSSLGTKI